MESKTIENKIDKGILYIWCNDAHEFLKYLRPTNPLWKPDPMGWVFRGQGHSKWDLIPSVFRKDTNVSFRKKIAEGPCEDIRYQLETEWLLIYDFLWLSDEIGLDVPGDGRIFREQKLIDDIVLKSIDELSWPPAEILETMALAQHHGVPTRLLDFTRNGLCAALFAGIQCKELNIEKEIDELKIDFSKHGLCVWAVPRVIKKMSDNRIHEHTVPRNGNKFLHAQNGLFFFDDKVNEIWNTKPEYPSLEKVISDLFLKNKHPQYDYYAVKQPILKRTLILIH